MAVGEWDQRQLCSDGACIGVIGPDGTCKVCGRAAPNWGDERNRGLIDPDDGLAADSDEDEDDEDDEDDDDEDGDDDEDEDGDDGDDDGEDGDDDGEPDDDEPDDDEPDEPAVSAAPRGTWSARQLCPNGGCIGVIGPDGRCKVCGRRASDAPADAPAEPPSSEAARPPAPVADPTAPAAVSSSATPAAPAGPTAPQDHAPGAGPPGESAAGPATALSASSPAASGPEPCPTPGCSGQIASDGRCAVCGKGAS